MSLIIIKKTQMLFIIITMQLLVFYFFASYLFFFFFWMIKKLVLHGLYILTQKSNFDEQFDSMTKLGLVLAGLCMMLAILHIQIYLKLIVIQL